MRHIDMDKWTELRTAYWVAKLGTVSAAAQALGSHRATVNRHIDVLEAEIDAKIFIRHARGYTLTEIGRDVLRVAQKTEELIDDLAGRVQGGKTSHRGRNQADDPCAFCQIADWGRSINSGWIIRSALWMLTWVRGWQS
jgi:DNA-binding transcriptional LysR family regulator